MVQEFTGAFSRRRLLKNSAILAAGLTLYSPLWCRAGVSSEKRNLSFYHTHTGEKLKITYARGSRYDSGALREINHYLRDFRTGDRHPIDPRLLDVLWRTRKELKPSGVFEVISGYRSPQTNSQLRQNSSGVAKKSLHMQGKAIDVRLTGTSIRNLQRSAMGLKCGGVGYYGKSNFVHLDTGRVRYW